MQQRRVRKTLLPAGATPQSGEKRGREFFEADIDLPLGGATPMRERQLVYDTATQRAATQRQAGPVYPHPLSDGHGLSPAAPQSPPPASALRSPSKRVRIEGYGEARPGGGEARPGGGRLTPPAVPAPARSPPVKDTAASTLLSGPAPPRAQLRPQGPRAKPYNKIDLFTPVDGKAGGGQELVVLVGAPSSGKSHLAKQLFATRGYNVVSHARVGANREKVATFANTALERGQSVVIDAANPDPETRLLFTHVAAKRGVPARCIHLATDVATAKQLDMLRCEADVTSAPVPDEVYEHFASRYRPPSMAEDFVEIRTVRFYPDLGGVV